MDGPIEKRKKGWSGAGSALDLRQTVATETWMLLSPSTRQSFQWQAFNLILIRPSATT